MSRTLHHLERLVAFPSRTGQPNGEIIAYIAGVLERAGARLHRVEEAGSGKAGLLARIGPGRGAGGVMLSGHVDVVPVEGQAWSSDPFRMRREAGRVFGRGTTDMKGFLACMLHAAERAAQMPLAEPLKLAFSWDEEIGCRGIPAMLARLDQTVSAPDICIVGEPTRMQIATGHKGKTVLLARCRGEAGHSADAPDYRNALHLAAEMIRALQDEQARLAREGARDAGYGTQCSSVHAGVMRGGTALNIVPELAEIEFEIRNLPEEPPDDILNRLRREAARIGDVEITRTGGYPGLSADASGDATRLMQQLLPDADLIKVSYGTEAGHFAARGIDTVVCGPGSMEQGHKPDEFIEIAELAACDAMLDRLLARMRR